jgi:ubiquitin C-terminal hydrolase
MKGLINVGNTCYFNSMLQCLLNCAPLVNYFYRSGYAGDNKAVKDFENIVNKYWKSDDNVVNPIELLKELATWSPQFRGNYQQDSHEAFLCIIEGLHKETQSDKQIFNDSPYYKLVKDGSAKKQWEEEESSLVTHLFNGQLKVTVSDVHYETFRSIELTPRYNTNVDALLFDYFKSEITEDTHTKIQKQIQFPPLCMTLAFKQYFKKLDIKFTETLDLSWYMAKDHHCPFKPEYQLYGMILHGGDRHGGHYISATRNMNNWYLNNDSRSSKVELKSIDVNSIYMLFYIIKKPYL